MARPTAELNRDKLKSLYGAKGWTQEKLASRAGVSYGRVNKIVNGAPASVETVRRLAKALDVDPRELGPPAERDVMEQELLNLFRPLVMLDKISVVATVREFVEGRSAARRVG